METIAEAGAADLVLIGVKLWDTEAAAASLRPAADERRLPSFRSRTESRRMTCCASMFPRTRSSAVSAILRPRSPSPA